MQNSLPDHNNHCEAFHTNQTAKKVFQHYWTVFLENTPYTEKIQTTNLEMTKKTF